ncbi:MAG: hypothetical protein E7020_04315 [Alphaproteobacteria bacterium]|nr:hypothetical protein [Alphaproteobacteria bacterium]
MVNYQKYMFDNFVVEDNKEKGVETDIVTEVCEINIPTQIDNDEDINIVVEQVEDTIVEVQNELEQDIITEVEPIIEAEPEVEPENIFTQPIVNEITYSEDELKEAIRQAEEVSYQKGLQEALEQETEKQNILLEDIKNKLLTILTDLDQKKKDLEVSSLRFAVELVRKILPTLERERAEAEIKSFLSDNFANFAAQDTLSFAFHPDAVALVANSLGRLAEQNDFEGKISVHKDTSLGISDCRVEWKSGGVERSTSKILNKIDDLVNDNTEERENG